MEKFLPISIQDFEQMITGNFLYVDKTRQIYELVRPPQGFYFLARPRRFGKSLMVSTLDHLFRGRRDLFENLHMAGTDWQWKTHPVLKIDFSNMAFQSTRILEQDLLLFTERIATEHGIPPAAGSLPYRFSSLIVDMARKYDEKIVILADEYDKPLIDHLGKGEDRLEIAKSNRDLLKQFFGVLKGGDVSAALRFVFLTGISKFARVSIFSDLNNLDDISMNESHADILGYTQEELESAFKSHIDGLAEAKGCDKKTLLDDIRRWYDGYRFTEKAESVYNPFSVTKFFKTGKFKNYWFETATPSFLVNLIREKNFPVTEIEFLNLPEELFSVYELDRLRPEPLLFQTGYITIGGHENELFRMKYPNREVRTSFAAYLLNDFTRTGNAAGQYKLLHICLREERPEDFIDGVRSIMGSIPYAQSAGQNEAYYHTVFYLMLSASGVAVHSEVLTREGRMDIAIEFDDKVFVIELKCDHDSGKAIRQILDKKYYEKYLETGRKIFLMGINFDSKKRSIDDWQCGELDEFLMTP